MPNRPRPWDPTLLPESQSAPDADGEDTTSYEVELLEEILKELYLLRSAYNDRSVTWSGTMSAVAFGVLLALPLGMVIAFAVAVAIGIAS